VCDCFSMAWPILMTLSAMMPSPTQRFIPASPFIAAAAEPMSPLALMRPSHPVRHFLPLRNHRFFCSCLRYRFGDLP
jgi:hypothetical protein